MTTPPITMTEIDLALRKMSSRDGLLFPHNRWSPPVRVSGTRIQGGFYDANTEAKWNAISWNPPQRAIDYPRLYSSETEADPTASPKPSFTAVEREVRAIRVEKAARPPSPSPFYGPTDKLANAPVAHPAGGDVHVGAGIDHMGGLDHLHARAAEAGADFRRVIMRNGAGTQTRELWRRRDVGEVLAQATDRRDLAEGARNTVQARHAAKAAEIELAVERARATDLTESERDTAIMEAESASTALQSMRLRIDDEIGAEYERLRTETTSLPNDVDIARDVLIARLSAVANRARNEVLAVVDAQDAHLPAACIEQESALGVIARSRQAGLLSLSNATTVAAMQAVFDGQKTIIENIQVLNSPLWRDAIGEDLTLNADGELVIDFTRDASLNVQDVVTVRTKQPVPTPPRLLAELGDLAIVTMEQVNPGAPWNRPPFTRTRASTPADDMSAKQITIQYGLEIPPPPESLVRLVARNRCGPGSLVIKVVNDPASP